MVSRWKKKSSRVAYQNPWIRIREDKVIRPDGVSGIYGVVELAGSSAVVALTSDVTVYLIKQWRYPLNRYTLELPWGGKRKAETYPQAARRELQEEAGVTASRWRSLGAVADCPGVVNEMVHLYLAENLTTVRRTIISEESDQEVIIVPFKKAWQWVQTNKICDAVTIAGLTRAKHKLHL